MPVIRQGSGAGEVPGFGRIVEDILSQCSDRDRKTVNLLLDGFKAENLNAEFYSKAFGDRNGFIRGYFRYDLVLRNAKTEYLNRSLGRPEGKDVVDAGYEGVDSEVKEISEVLSSQDLLERERGLDKLVWRKCEELVQLHTFDLDIILGFIARLHIIDRWATLDPETGKEAFDKLLNEIRTDK